MEFADCYRLLGLRSGASFTDIKASYRRLAQQYHPDINRDDKRAKEKFIALTEAYKLLLQVVPPQENSVDEKTPEATAGQQVETSPKSTKVKPKPKSTHKKPKPKAKAPKPPQVAEVERQLKWKTYEHLQQFLQERRFPQAIALVEALAQRLPQDAEVRQWQAISYQIWGRALIKQKQLLKARIYLKKALKTDPNNKSLWNEVQRDFHSLEEIF